MTACRLLIASSLAGYPASCIQVKDVVAYRVSLWIVANASKRRHFTTLSSGLFSLSNSSTAHRRSAALKASWSGLRNRRLTTPLVFAVGEITTHTRLTNHAPSMFQSLLTRLVTSSRRRNGTRRVVMGYTKYHTSAIVTVPHQPSIEIYVSLFVCEFCGRAKTGENHSCYCSLINWYTDILDSVVLLNNHCLCRYNGLCTKKRHNW
jgi:hypothetical protein